MCPCKVDHDGHAGYNTYERMVELINDMYYSYDVLGFSYSFNQCTIRKDMYGDLRVECIMKCLNDCAAVEIESRRHLACFFLPLMLAQTVTLEKTELSPDGAEKVAKYLGSIKDSNLIDEPFSLIIETEWHPPERTFPFTEIKCFLKTAKYLSVVHYRCTCTPKCFHIKKTYKGEIEDVI
ncbi:hypothetical protein GWK47_029192 [Chionoecetes opilio]|uniref:Uncharacterized protein n=1 Tax=Chionoecetes opilio TaxID=41210 RepID=A0A8J4YSM1_CHIOP|nr:hypothetical protein GWK47_029192 [Chionoecetes opilio]